MDPVQQFKFACPVCGQHLQAGVREVGRTTECPSCFKKLTVPQAPTDSGTKLIISAALADTRRAPFSDHAAPAHRVSRPAASKGPLIYILLATVAVMLTVGVLIVLRSHQHAGRGDSRRVDLWTDKAYQLNLFETPAQGRLKGRDFTLTRALWRDTSLILDQHQGQPDALSLRITFPLRGGELVSGKTFLLGPDDPPFDTPLRITWLDKSGHKKSQTVRSGYILRIRFDAVSKTTVSGRIHLCLLDPDKSWVAGRFSARNVTKIK